MNRVRLLWGLSLLTILATLLGSCAAPATPQVVKEPVPVTVQVTKEVRVEVPVTVAPPTPKPEAISLLVWDTLAHGPQETEVIAKLQQQFEAKHPGVKITRVVKSFEDMKTVEKLALSNPLGPDIAMIDQGEADMGAMVKAGLLLDLTPYAKKYGWFNKIAMGIHQRNTWSADGKKFGEGNLYGISVSSQAVGVFYRKDVFAKEGLSVPKTFAEFETILEKLKAKGYTPITFGNLDGFPAVQIWSEIQNAVLGEKANPYINDLIFKRGNQTWVRPENVEAARILQDWVKKGYFTKGYEGISYNDSTALFQRNSASSPMMLTGSWMSAAFQGGPDGDKLGFFLVPPMTAGAYKMSVGGVSIPFCIRAGTKYPDLAAEYLDLLAGEQAANEWQKVGQVPILPVDPSLVKQGTLFADMLSTWQYMNKNDAIGHFLGWATPTFRKTSDGATQELMAFKITPEQFVQKLEADYSAFLKQIGQ